MKSIYSPGTPPPRRHWWRQRTRTKAGGETVLHRFTGGGEDGQQPVAGLILDADGNFYGTTVAGGSANDGTVYRMSKSGKVTILHSFTGNDGVEPTSWLNQDAAGNFYGTAITGGLTGEGTVFKITKAGKFTLLYTFKGTPDGGLPQGTDTIPAILRQGSKAPSSMIPSNCAHHDLARPLATKSTTRAMSAGASLW